MRRACFWLAVVAAVTFAAGPFLWQVVTSVRPEDELLRLGLLRTLSLDSYRSAFEGRPLGRVLLNS